MRRARPPPAAGRLGVPVSPRRTTGAHRRPLRTVGPQAGGGDLHPRAAPAARPFPD
ncbi:hypothetical protein [Pseudonocardia kunmingensis]|uniref:hypothetical protein n=1 Tax=Pseudonocardia kunmingensis TaxID=630975 RepID=UPI001478090B|nr:hypothetical protein [Pseudonocardia kunmingensis]